MSTALNKLLRSTDAPWVATVFVGLFATVLCFLSNIVAVVTFVSVLTIAIYVFVGATAIVSRLRDKSSPRTFRMPLFPLPPLIAIVGAVVAMSQQTTRDLVIVVIIYAAGIAYYFIYLRSKTAAMAALRATGADS